MFYSLTGTVVFADESSVALDCGGVAFRLFTTGNTLRQCAPVGEVQTLYTHLNVREDALDLFGFAEKSELDCFKMLTGVTGVGPKAGLAILSCLTPDMLAVSVAGGDVKAITAAQGVGSKLAQRIVLELKGKLDSFASSLREPRQYSGGSKGDGQLRGRGCGQRPRHARLHPLRGKHSCRQAGRQPFNRRTDKAGA